MSDNNTLEIALRNVQIVVADNTVRSEFAEAVKAAQGITVVSDDAAFERSGAAQTLLSKLISGFDKKRLELTRPIDALKKSVIAAADAFTSPARKELDRVRGMNNVYATAKAREAEQERLRIEKQNRERAEAESAEQQRQNDAAEKQRLADAQSARAVFGESAVVAQKQESLPVVVPTPTFEPEVVPRVSAPRTQSNNIVKVWKHEVTDAAKVPREFMAVDESKIRAFISYQQSVGNDLGNIHVDGIRFYWESSVRSK